MASQGELRHRPVSIADEESQTIDIPGTSNQQDEEDRSTTEHAKRLKTYTGSSLTITMTLIVSFYNSKITKEANKFFILASFFSLLFAFFFELVLMLLAYCVGTTTPSCVPCSYQEHLYIFVYLSNFMLMLTTFSLLLLCNTMYAFLAALPVLALLANIILFRRGRRLGHTKVAVNYKEHDNKLKLFSELSAGVTIASCAGLSGAILFSPSLPHQSQDVKVAVSFLFVTIIVSLFVMLLTSVPPAANHKNTRTCMIGVVRALGYSLLCLLTLVGLMATAEISQGFVVVSLFVHVAGALYWFAIELHYHDGPEDRRNKIEEQEPELDKISMVLGVGAFGLLMAVYSTNVTDGNEYRKQVWACMLSLCSTFISCVSRLYIVSKLPNTGAWDRAVGVSTSVTVSLVLISALTGFWLIGMPSLF